MRAAQIIVVCSPDLVQRWRQ